MVFPLYRLRSATGLEDHGQPWPPLAPGDDKPARDAVSPALTRRGFVVPSPTPPATDARLWEIAENLHRSELTVQERADHVAEWVKLVSDKLSETSSAKGGRPGAAAIVSRLVV